MMQIDNNHATTIDYGGPLRGAITSATLQAKLTSYAAKLQEYNRLLQQADTISNTLKDLEEEIASDFTATLKAAAGKFGENSNEVEMLGGTRKEDRKRRKVIKKAA
jgi:ABC-type transporter Mla subunit MlaD